MVHETSLHPSPLIAVLLFVVGCATTAFDIGSADRTLTPNKAAADFASARDRELAWGGVIVAAKNLKDRTQVEILGYPLDDGNRPDQDAAPIGRYIAVHSGYLETADYAPGRLVTAVGKVTETRAGTIGEAQYNYPVLVTNRIYLWSKTSREPSGPSIHFGIGIGISR